MTIWWYMSFIVLLFSYTLGSLLNNSFPLLGLLLIVLFAEIFFCIFFPYPWTLLMKYFIFPIFPEKFYSMLWPILLYFFLFSFPTDNTPIQPSNYNQIIFHHALLFLIVPTKLAQLALYLDCFWSHLFCLFWWWCLLFTWASCVLGFISLYRENGLPKFILNPYCVLKRLGKDLELEGNQPKDGPKIPSAFSYIEIVL